MPKKITNRHGDTVAHVSDNGRITNTHGDTTGYVDSHGRITDRHGDTVGYVDKNGRMTDKHGDTIGYHKDDGRLTDRYGDTSGYVKEDTSGCFLTSACVAYKGLPDDCEELTVLRQYRDYYLRGFKEGQNDVERYYQIAPVVVKAIEALPSSERSACYEHIFCVVSQCVSEIKHGSLGDAHSRYKDLVLTLRRDLALT